MKFLRILWAHVQANVHALILQQHVHVVRDIGPRRWQRKTVRISVGEGSIITGTWKDTMVFYDDRR